MKYNTSYILGAILAIPVAIITGIISMNIFQFEMWLDTLIMFGSYIMTFLPVQQKAAHTYLKEIGLSKNDYKYVRKQLKIAEPKIKHLLVQYKKVRSLSELKNVNEINKLARVIFKNVQKSPSKFFNVDSFFFSHLDNTVNLLNEYLYLSRMPHKTKEDQQLLNHARLTLDELKRTLQADLRALNKESYETMRVEINLADNYTTKQLFNDKQSQIEHKEKAPLQFKNAVHYEEERK
ncbi:5-bromo-4-chloroindolyl phosphate hydrolysis family protein [Macrococcus sp. S115]|uniref:5-bromo-4-chloroindolyl phosphate hydrolysis family protein n=1 Tax=Macrococcus psychrotolerans TaxID=3039389 RepID=A0AAT9P361_9STAP|nr:MULTISPECIES: 5-bromo-4-chloroindolyl phosphate hydrolysis family protein [Macrococcus]MDJ1111891.1 5-bromo-4-chloroindolyl phosphate hydrolysis family protein [Macrococcus sp. S115]QYA31827.1 5-bromo-4-chloroindolyl phosphate hydrolysis family protein [Macrococcus sp. 19Msa1099]QYA36633.1 5-bromo-4-chloroindolyl phosphate hydrolysis family protein [Macrococcus caseolyticus]QYA75341.1 5-bromo-4-chloroindolyl phosphate hydrolysis family protein [Macrococcus caseolyticus]